MGILTWPRVNVSGQLQKNVLQDVKHLDFSFKNWKYFIPSNGKTYSLCHIFNKTHGSKNVVVSLALVLTESQSHWVGRHLWKSSGPTPLPRQVTQEHVQGDFEWLQRGTLHSFPAQPVQVLCYPATQNSSLCCGVVCVLVYGHYSTGHHWKESGIVFLTPAFEIFISTNESPSQSSFLWTKQTLSVFSHKISVPDSSSWWPPLNPLQ